MLYKSNLSEIIEDLQKKLKPLTSVDEANRILSTYKCPIHNQIPTATKVGTKMTIEFCCAESKAAGERILGLKE